MAAPREIIDLIERFARNTESYRSGHYGETQVRVEFINPFFKCLGWDIDNTQGFAEAYKDVINEDAIKVGGVTKAPDYCFRIGGTRKFFLEAKRPSVNLKSDPEPAFQLRRYAYTAQLPLSILTDFEEFAVYDGRLKPAQTDKASAARIRYLTFNEYPEQWDSIAETFSKDAVLKGSFDKYAEAKKLKRGTATFDADFLKEIEGWRELLAKNIALRNPALSQRELNYAVQVTIDRILFLRMCEARGVEQYGQLAALQNGPVVYGRLKELFRKADERYNSGLFHFTKEAERPEPPDQLTTALTIDDKPLKDIFKSLYYPDSPYEFSVLPAEILGQVYEQFLGKVIRLTGNHRAIVEEKPEVRKAGGVYYTPTYIVDYIVKNTVGKLLDGKTPKQASKLKILDPACGSGSFLLGAYQFLLDWHCDRYIEMGTAKPAKEIFQGRGGAWHLTSAEKKRILLNNIHGVDVDPQAVEVTKLSLLLKVLEGESQQALERQLVLFHERALPDLASNIKCGNSLIGPDFYEGQQLTLFDEEERYRINVFDWSAEFPAIMKAGGFDAVIGNPPYIFTRDEGINEHEKAYYYAHYKRQSSQLNTFGIFLEQCHGLLGDAGALGFITPNNWLTINTFAPLREFLLCNTGNLQITNILDRVFAAAHVDTAIVRFEKRNPTGVVVAEMLNGQETFSREVPMPVFKAPEYVFQINLLKDSGSQRVIERIESGAKALSHFSTVSTGLKAYQTGKGKPAQTDHQKTGRVFHGDKKIDATFGRYLDGVDVGRYRLSWSGEYLSYGDWLAEPRKSVPFEGDRMLVRQIPSKLPYLVNAVFTNEPYFNDINSMVVFSPANATSLKYLLAIINSRLMSFWFMKTFDKMQRKIFPQFKVNELARFPIHDLHLENAPEKARHDSLVRLADGMLSLHKLLAAAKTPHEQKSLETQIGATDRQIDNLVYELYGLTPEEIQIVENAGADPATSKDAAETPAVPTNGPAETYVPYQPALDAGINEEWDRKNARRLDLVEREVREQLTPEEKAELEELQNSFFAYIQTIFPRSWILDDDRLEKLEQKYKDAKKP
jgi:hypothetical protein